VRYFFLIAQIIFCISSISQSAELRSWGENVRGHGMGGVRVFDGTQASVMMWNPAGLNYMKGFHFDVLDFSAATDGKESYEKLKNVGTISTFADLNGLYGIPIHADNRIGVNLAIPHFGISAFSDFNGDFSIRNPTLPEIQAAANWDYGVYLGGAFDVGPIAFGIAGKRVNRRGGDVVITADQLIGFDTTSIQSLVNDSGVGFGFDLGMMYRPGTNWNPTLGLTWQDVGTTTYYYTGGTKAPPPTKDNVILSGSFQGEAFLTGIAGGFEYRHISNSNEQLGKKIHLGIEASLLNFDFRAGLYQGYPTYGVGVDLFLVEVNAAYYKVETGLYPGETIDERIEIGITTGFGFDSSKGGLSSFSKRGRRSLKQRR
jgi:hypothetical protein